MQVNQQKPLRTAIIGCGAVVQQYQGPAAVEAAKSGWIEIVALCDQDSKSITNCGRLFPQAIRCSDLDMLPPIDLALVATPASTHAKMSQTLLKRGIHILVEKPMASNVHDGREMITAARDAGKMLAVGHFRRFFPAVEMIDAIVKNKSLGRVLKVTVEEGGLFRWPAASASFFDPSLGGGGVTLDIGVHMIELLISWFGVPEVTAYADDAFGGVEINSRGSFKWLDGLTADFRLSWDVPQANRYCFHCEQGALVWYTNSAQYVSIAFKGSPYLLHGELQTPFTDDTLKGQISHEYRASFTAQWRDICEAITTGRAPRVSAGAGLQALECIEKMRQCRNLIIAPYWSEEEARAALAIGNRHG